MRIKPLKQYLYHKTKEALIDEITDLFSKFKIVQDYYQRKLGTSENGEILEKYKALVTREFFPARGYGKARLSIAKNAVTDFRKISQSKTEWIEIMLHYVEMGVRFTNAYGDIDESFYTSMEGMYEQVLKFILQAGIKQEFQQRCRRIVTDTDGIGWGFHDALADMYQETFEQNQG